LGTLFFAKAVLKRTDISDGILIIIGYHYIKDIIQLKDYKKTLEISQIFYKIRYYIETV